MSGHEPVRERPLGLPVEDRRAIGRNIAIVELRWPFGMPTCRLLREVGEIRTSLTGNRIARVRFAIEDTGAGYCRTGSGKQTRRTPPEAIRRGRAATGERPRMSSNETAPPQGGAFGNALAEEAEREAAIKRVLARELEELMACEGLSRAALARRMGTSRWSLYCLLDPTHDAVMLGTLRKAARAVGRRVEVRLVTA